MTGKWEEKAKADLKRLASEARLLPDGGKDFMINALSGHLLTFAKIADMEVRDGS
jgi:hypothetical protein